MLLVLAGADDASPQAVGDTTYADVAPILAERCVICHSGDAAPAGLRLDGFDALLQGGLKGPVVKAGDPAASELVRRVRGQARPRMPFDGPPYLTSDEIRLVEDWVAQGARSGGGITAPVPIGATVRLHGTLGPQWRLDDLPLAVGPETRIDKAPRPGDYIEVRGRVGEGASVEVERLRRR